jgi:phage protein U
MLGQLGSVTFEVWPVNIHETDRQAAADHVAKDVLGTLRPREFVGEGDDQITLRGRLFPETFGGSTDELHAMRISGTAQVHVRGDGRSMGWWLIERVSERASYLDRQGRGRVIEFEVSMVRAAPPSPASYLSTLLRLAG